MNQRIWRGLSINERMDLLTEKRGKYECWPWIGGIERKGYGIKVYHNGRQRRPHCVAIELATGQPIPKGMVVDHVCRNRRCVNPEHLRVVSRRVNALENSLSPLAMKSRQTHCKHGHAFTPENTHIHNGKRSCKACWKRRHRLQRQTSSEAA
jgi:hypothetical protein